MTQKVQVKSLSPLGTKESAVEQTGEIILYSSSNTIRIITATETRLGPRSKRDYKKCVYL